MKKLIITALLVSSLAAFSQTYKSAIGGKLGYGLVGSYKYFISPKSALEGYLGFGWYNSGFIGGLNYNYHIQIPDVKGLTVPIGAGAMIGSYGGGASIIVPAITLNIGVEYAFTDMPLTLGVEYMPALGFANGYNGYLPGFASIVGRYILSRK